MLLNRRRNRFVETMLHEAKHIAIWKCQHPGPDHTDDDNHPDSKVFLEQVRAELSYLRAFSPTVQLYEKWMKQLWHPRLNPHTAVEKAAKNAMAGKPVPD